MDQTIEYDISEELRFHPQLDGSDIAVAVKDGGVLLSDFVCSFLEKYEAERAAEGTKDVETARAAYAEAMKSKMEGSTPL